MGKKFYIETYGCQMNVADSEVVAAILTAKGYEHIKDRNEADIILVNTCSVRENAEQRVRGRVQGFSEVRKQNPHLLIGVMGCMAERLGEKLFEQEKNVNIIVGPDAYMDLPLLIEKASRGEKAIKIQLSETETYKDICPSRIDETSISGFVSIMRGCNNFCSYCVVPYTRGRERSRDPQTILREAQELFSAGYREVTLLGQNVNSYRWKEGTAEAVDFPALVERVAGISPLLRVRFATSHPKDLSDRLIEVMASYPNICRAVHLPAQSGSDRMLAAMNRKYTRAWYLERVAAIRRRMPDCAVTTDLIAGFCGETAEDHAQTLSLMREVGYDSAYMFKYSQRPGTLASRTMTDDVSEEVKTARLNEIIALQNELSTASNERDMGNVFEVLVEGLSRRSSEQLCGRTSQNKMVVFDRTGETAPGDYVRVRITGCTSATLFGVAE